MLFKVTIIIPVYQHGKILSDTLGQISRTAIPIIAINDGSDPGQSRLIEDACKVHGATLVSRSSNGGKGSAVIDGLNEASKLGFTHAFQVDADGQHDYSRIPDFVEMAKNNMSKLILGYPVFDESIPIGRKLGRWLTNIWVWINTLSLRVRDPMCGFRVYPIEPMIKIINGANIGKHMDFDPELCVRACWANFSIVNLPVTVVYPQDGVSNFRFREDNFLITLMHTRLFFGMLVRSPVLLFQGLRRLFA